MVVKMNPVMVKPRCRCRLRISIPSTNAVANALERKAADVVPVEPDEKRLAPDVIVGNEAPIAAVVAIVPVVAHHEITAGGHLAGKSSVIVNTVLAAGELAHVVRIDRLHGGVLGDCMLARADPLQKSLRCRVAQAFEITICAVGRLRPGCAIDGNLLVAVNDLVAGKSDQALDEILRGDDGISKHDDIAALRLAE